MVLTLPMYRDGRFLGRYIHTLLQLNSIYVLPAVRFSTRPLTITMNGDYKGLEVKGTDPFDDWFDDERADLIDDDVDDMEEDDYSENDYE